MRIALLTSEFPPFNGGVATYARELALAAAAAGHEVTVLAPDYGQDNRAADAASPFRVVRFRGGPSDARGLARRVAQTRRLLRSGRFDVVHAADWPFFIPLRMAAGIQPQARRLLTVHGTEILYMRRAKRRLLLDLLGFWRPDWATWIANSRYTADLLLATFGRIDGGAVRAIPLAVSADWTSGRVARAEARTAYALAAGDFVIVSLGRVVPRKGHGTLAAALARLPAQARTIRWWVIGPLLDGDHAAELRAATAGLAARVEFLGPLPTADVQRRLSAADLFCLPGHRDEDGRVEGFGLVFLEAAAYGVPALATLSGGIPEAVEQGVTGMLVPERDPDALADALAGLLDDPLRREAMARAAADRAAATTWSTVMQQTYREQP